MAYSVNLGLWRGIMKITKATIDKCKPKEKRYEISDDKLAGFKLRVGQSKKTFVVRYRFGGVRRTYTIGDYGAWTPEKARKRATSILRQVDEGIDPAISKQEIKNAPTFELLAKDYLTYTSKRSISDDEGKLNNILIPAWKKKPVSAINCKDIRKLIKKLEDKGLKNATLNRYLALIKVMFNRAVEWGVIEKNPAISIKPLKENPHRERYLNKIELNRLFTALGNAPKNAANALKFLLMTGQRAGNVKSIKWSDISDDGLWTIELTKSGKAHRVWLSDDAKNILNDQYSLSGDKKYIFPGKRKDTHLMCLESVWNSIRAEAKLDDVRIHDLRHTFASWAINNGASLYEVQKILGHSGPQMTQRYAHIAEDKQQQVASTTTKAMVISMEEYKNNNKVINQ
jgi:integrase